jgi:hypothetical protein
MQIFSIGTDVFGSKSVTLIDPTGNKQTPLVITPEQQTQAAMNITGVDSSLQVIIDNSIVPVDTSDLQSA